MFFRPPGKGDRGGRSQYPTERRIGREAWILFVFPLLALFLLADVLIGGRVLLPADYLRGFSPWSQTHPAPPDPATGVPALPQWNVLQWDAMAEFYPWREHAAREMSDGRIPLWNPAVLSGTPFLANSQSAPLYPLHLLYYLPLEPLGAGTAVRMGWLAFLHLALAGTFAYLLARDLGARPGAAAAAGAAYELSGFAVAWLELPTFLSVAAWIPLVLLCLGRAVRGTGGWRCLLGAGAAGGVMLLAGHLQIAFYGLLAAGGVWLWETAAGSRRAERRAPFLAASLAKGALFLGVAFALAAPQVLPSMELSRMSHRVAAATEAGYAAYAAFAMPVRNWVTLLVPDYYGLPGLGNFWGFWNYHAPNVMEYAGWIGAPGFVLVAIGALWGRKITPRAGLWLALGAAALLLAAGTPLNRLLYFGIPGFAQSGSPARSLVLFTLAQAMLVGLGAEWLLRRSEQGLRAVVGPVLAGLGITLAAMAGLHLAAHARLSPDSASLAAEVALPALFQAALLASLLAGAVLLFTWLFRENSSTQRTAALSAAIVTLLGGSLLFLGQPYNLTAAPEMVYPSTPLTEALRSADGRVATLNREWSVTSQPSALLPPNASLAYGWRDAQGYDSLYLGHSRRLLNAVAAPAADAGPAANGNIAYVKHAGSPLLPLLGARYLVSDTPLRQEGLLPAPGFPPGPPYVYEDRFAAPEAYTVADWRVAEDAAGLDLLRSAGRTRVRDLAIVAPAPAALAAPAAAGAYTPAAPAALRRAAPGRLVVEANPDVPSLLVLVEGYAPGWRATVRKPGQPPVPAPVVRVNTAFQGVFLDPGPATVEWRYQPASFRTGLFLHLLALAALAALAIPFGKRAGAVAGADDRAETDPEGPALSENPQEQSPAPAPGAAQNDADQLSQPHPLE